MLRGGQIGPLQPPTQDEISINWKESAARHAACCILGGGVAFFLLASIRQKPGAGCPTRRDIGHSAPRAEGPGTGRCRSARARRTFVAPWPDGRSSGRSRESTSDRVSLAAAGCAFYATLALFPAISTLISVYGLAFDVQSVEQQLQVLRDLLPAPAFALIDERVHQLVSQATDTLSTGLHRQPGDHVLERRDRHQVGAVRPECGLRHDRAAGHRAAFSSLRWR